MLDSAAQSLYSPRMADYFTVLGLKPAFPLNLNTLEEHYIAAQREAHPDRHVGKPEAERLALIQRSMLVNDAYETLKNPLSRAEHLLEMQGIFVNSEDDTVKPEPALLMEVMELREQLQDASNDREVLRHLLDDIKKAMQDCSDGMEEAFGAADYPYAAKLTMRLQYLGKALEEAHMLLYRLKTTHNHDEH